MKINNANTNMIKYNTRLFDSSILLGISLKVTVLTAIIVTNQPP